MKFTKKDFPIDSLITFKNGEVWIVVKPGLRRSDSQVGSDEITAKPYNSFAKSRNVSLPSDFYLDYLNTIVTNVTTESVSVNEAITQSQLQQAVDILSKKWNIPSKKLLSDPTDQQLDQIEALAKKMKSTGSHSIGDYLNEAFLGVHLEPSDAAKIAKIVKPAKMNLTGFSEWLYAQLEDEFESVDEVLDRLKATSNDEMEEYDLNRAEYQREIKKVLSQALYEFEMKGDETKCEMMDQQAARQYARGLIDKGMSTADANVEMVRMMGVQVISGKLIQSVRAALLAGVKDGRIGRLPKDGSKPETFFHPNSQSNAKEIRNRIALKKAQTLIGMFA